MASRHLSPKTTFGVLVDQIAALDSQGLGHSDDQCVLQAPKDSDTWHLSADLAVAVHPLPQVPSDLDDQLNNREASSVLTRWGHVGAGARGLMLAALTASPPSARQQVLILVITDRGVYGRSSNVAVPLGWNGALAPKDAITLLQKKRTQLASAVDGIYLTAERDIPLQHLKVVLGDLSPLQIPVALATSLAKGTRQPPTQRQASSELLCPNGLTPLPKGTAFGTLEPAQLQDVTMRLKQRAAVCMEHASGTSAEGELLKIVSRLNPQGNVVQTCFVADELSDVGLRRCVEKVLLDLSFPAPNPPGYVDIRIPLRFVYLPATAQKPLCQ